MGTDSQRSSAIDYNERLFSGNSLRSRLHNSRFLWFRNTVQNLAIAEYRAVELGCFDGRLLGFFPSPPLYYQGLDADWEGGLSAAQEQYRGHERWHFRKATNPSVLTEYPDNAFNIGASLETLEHVPPPLVDGYLEQLARTIDGYMLITVPNEKGLVFLTKWLIKKMFLGSEQPYRFAELVAATFGQMNRVERNDHKGFDYDALIGQVARHFDLVRVEGLPWRRLPLSLSFTVCILAKSKVAPAVSRP